MKSYSLKSIRINLGLTQEEASKRIGVCKYTLSNYENYKTKPNFEILRKIMDAYGVSIDEIRILPNENEIRHLTVEKKE